MDFQVEVDYCNVQVGQYYFVDIDDIYGNIQLQSVMNVMFEEFCCLDLVLQIVDILGIWVDIFLVD